MAAIKKVILRFLTLILILAPLFTFGQDIKDKKSSEILLKYLLEKYPTDFNRDSTKAAGFYSEEYGDTLKTQHSLLVVDKKAKGTKKLLRPVKSNFDLNNYYPNIDFFYVEMTCNWEYNSGVLKTIFGLNHQDTSTIGKLEPLTYGKINKKFVSLLKTATIDDRRAKITLSKSLFDMFLFLKPGFVRCREAGKTVSVKEESGQLNRLVINIKNNCNHREDNRLNDTLNYNLSFKFFGNKLGTIREVKK